MKPNLLREKSFNVALRMVNLYKHLCSEQSEYILSKQLLRSGTAIGALQRESEHAESKIDFIHKLAIAQKECNESLYWIELLYKANYISESAIKSLNDDAEELIKLITAIIKSSKSTLTK